MKVLPKSLKAESKDQGKYVYKERRQERMIYVLPVSSFSALS